MVSLNHNQTTLHVAYVGPLLAGGTMDVKQLAPAMLAMGDLLETANLIVNGNGTSLRLEASATSTGSFEITFNVIQSIQAANVAAGSFGELFGSAADIVTLILGGKGLFALLKWLRDRVPQITQVDSDQYDVTVDGETRRVTVDVVNLHSDPKVRISSENIVRPLRTQGIENISFEGNGQSIQQINEDEAEYFNTSLSQEQLQDSIREMTFSIVSLSFRENNVWKVSDGQTTYGVRMRDTDFWKRVDDGQVSFSNGDLLKCNFRTKQYRINGEVKADYEILEVLEHLPMRQLRLLEEESGNQAESEQ